MWKGGINWHGYDFDIEVSSFENRTRNQRKQSEFIGDWPVFTRSGVIKPIFNAFKALSLITGSRSGIAPNMIDAEFTVRDPIDSIAVLKDGGIYLLLNNYVPTIRLGSYVEGTMPYSKVTGPIKEELLAVVQCVMTRVKKYNLNTAQGIKDAFLACKGTVTAKMKDQYKIEALNTVFTLGSCLPDEVKNTLKDNSTKEMKEKAINGIVSCSNRISDNVKNPKIRKLLKQDIGTFADIFRKSKTVGINYVHLPFPVSSHATIYTIDSRHSNSCRYNRKTAKSSSDTPCGIGGEIDRSIWKLRKKIKCKDDIRICLKSRKTYERYERGLNKINSSPHISLEGSMEKRPLRISEQGYKLDVDMEPNSIVLIVLEKAHKRSSTGYGKSTQ
jgi:hypothetical protein